MDIECKCFIYRQIRCIFPVADGDGVRLRKLLLFKLPAYAGPSPTRAANSASGESGSLSKLFILPEITNSYTIKLTGFYSIFKAIVGIVRPLQGR